MKETTVRCDICKSKNQVHDGKKMQVIFTTEQNEGRSTTPYLSVEAVDICTPCIDRVLGGDALYGEGAMGYNKYYFKP